MSDSPADRTGMADKDLGTTLAYTKSPKTSRRTTFQDELEAAVSSRASKKKPDQYSYSDDFDDEDGDEKDVLKELLNSRKKRIDAFKAGKKIATINDFYVLDDKEENERPKKVSFMKLRKPTYPSQDLATPDSHISEDTDSSIRGGDQSVSDSLPSQRSNSPHQDYTGSSASHSSPIQSPRSLSSHPRSLSSHPRQTQSTFHPTKYSNSDWDSPLPLPSDGSQLENLLPMQSKNSVESIELGPGEEGEPAIPQPLQRSISHASMTDRGVHNEPPRPKPRHKPLRVNTDEEQAVEDRGTPPSRTPTSSMSIALSSIEQGASNTSTSSSRKTTAGSHSPHATERDMSSTLSSAADHQSVSVYKSTEHSSSGEGHILEDRKANDGKYSTSFEEYQDDSDSHPDHKSKFSHLTEKSANTRSSSSLTKSSSKSQSVCFYTAESKYLGSLKVLDRKVQLNEVEPEAADNLRAAIYQDWLKKKREKLQEMMRIKKQEEMLKEEKRKRQEQVKVDDAKASYDAWKDKKSEVIKAKVKEKQDMIKKKQMEIDEQDEKKESAKKVFEKWKQDHDEVLKTKYREKKDAEKKLKQRKEEKEEERKRDASSALSSWNERKKVVVHEKVKTERQKLKIKEEEERYEKEEKERMALEMYEKWLKRKERQQTRQRTEKQIQAILQDEPPPPWSPPSKTVPFGK
ncbi:hypothetical protein UPYG_G00041210 [Umbra pygmaea]|uniref:Microtubule-associated protein 9 n=1 Tax=Umbra pygmaea TaxID=75934 RepID=A0ABD0XQ27_UMBPY